MIRNTLYLFLFFLLVTSCTIETVTIFNEDFSGSTYTVVTTSDTSENTTIPALDSIHIEGTEYYNKLDSMQTEMSKYGIQNFSIDSSEGGTKTSFDFTGLHALNQDLGELFSDDIYGLFEDEDPFMSFYNPFLYTKPTISKQGKWITIEYFSETSYEELEASLSDDENDTIDPGEEITFRMLKGMGELYEFENTYKFPKKIKKIESNVPYKIREDELIIDVSLGDLFEIFEEQEQVIIKIKI